MPKESIPKKLKLKEISVAVIASARPMRSACAGRCWDPKTLHTLARITNIRSLNTCIRRGWRYIWSPYTSETQYIFLYTWIDSRLPHIRNRVTQRLIWLLKIEGLFVGTPIVSRFPGLLAHWVFFGDSRFGTTTDGKRANVPVLLCYNKSYGVSELHIPFWWLSARGRGWRCKQV